MNGIMYPEISEMSNAQIGGYLSAKAATQLAAFKTKASRPRFKFQNFTSAESDVTGTTFTIPYTAPEGYTAIGAVGFNVDGRGWGGAWANNTRGQVYTQQGTYAATVTPTIQILFKRT